MLTRVQARWYHMPLGVGRLVLCLLRYDLENRALSKSDNETSVPQKLMVLISKLVSLFTIKY